MVAIKLKKKIMKMYYNLQKTRIDANCLERDIKKKEECLERINNIKNELECSLHKDKKKFNKLQEIIKTFLA